MENATMYKKKRTIGQCKYLSKKIHTAKFMCADSRTNKGQEVVPCAGLLESWLTA